MANMAYVCLYHRYIKTLEPFSDEERGRLMVAMLAYAMTGEIPTFTGNERYIWPTIQAQIDRDNEAYKKRCQQNRENGTKGGRPRKNQPVNLETERFLEKPNKANTNTNSICITGDGAAPGLDAGEQAIEACIDPEFEDWRESQ